MPAERWALACPALPTCGLALTEAERVSDSMIGEIVERMARWGVEQERVSIRITGCPNGCARPYSGDIGIVGRIPGFYSIYVGGDFEGTRLNEVVAERIRLDEVADVLDPLFARLRGAATGRRRVWRFLPPGRRRRAARGRRRVARQDQRRGGLVFIVIARRLLRAPRQSHC